MNTPQTIRTLIADDHDLVRSGMKLLLEMIDGVEVVYEARSGSELLAAAQRLAPDLLVTDITMPDMDGLSALAKLREIGLPDLRVLVVSMHDSPDVIRRAVQLGAHAYVMKGSPPQELEQAVRNVMSGRAYFSPEVTQRLLTAGEPQAEDVLTERQLEILKLIASGFASKEIAFKLGLSSKTVDVHRSRIMERLNIGDIASLTLYSVRQGLVDPGAAQPQALQR
jgi:DNA-binding NarL/FixJ family response regulator